jgi:hypothetical protein
MPQGSESLLHVCANSRHRPSETDHSCRNYRALGCATDCSTAGAPELPDIQALKPTTKKNVMSAIDAIAKFLSARCNRSDHFRWLLPFIRCFTTQEILVNGRPPTSATGADIFIPHLHGRPSLYGSKHAPCNKEAFGSYFSFCAIVRCRSRLGSVFAAHFLSSGSSPPLA